MVCTQDRRTSRRFSHRLPARAWIGLLLTVAAMEGWAQPLDPLFERESADAQSSERPSPVRQLLGELDFFPSVIVVPPADLQRFDEAGTVIIPKKSLDSWLENQVSERIRDQAPATITSVDLEIQIDEDPAPGRAIIGLRADGAGAWIPIGLKEATLVDAELREIIAEPEDIGGVRRSEPWTPPIRRVEGDTNGNGPVEGGFEIRIDRAGNYECTLTFQLDVESSPLESSLQLTLPTATLTRARLRSEQPLLVVRRTGTNEGVSLSPDRLSADLSIRPGEDLALQFRVASSSTSAAVSSADARIYLRLGDDSLDTETVFDLDAPREVTELAFVTVGEEALQVLPLQKGEPLPHDVQSARVGEGETRTVVRFARSVVGPFQVRLTSRRRRSEESSPLVVTSPVLEGVSRQTGTFLLSWTPNLWVRSKPGGNLRRVALSELGPEAGGSAVRQAYRFSSVPATIEMTVEPAQPVVSATATSDLTIATDVGRLTTRFTLRVRGAEADSFLLSVPTTMVDLEAEPANLVRLVERPAAEGSTRRPVLVKLSEPIEDSEVQVTLRGNVPLRGVGPFQIELPSVEPERLSKGSLTVRIASNVRPILDETTTEYLRREPMPEDDVVDPPAYWYFRRLPGRARLGLSIEPLRGQVEAFVETELRRLGDGLEGRTFLRFQSRRTPFDEVTVQIPEGLEEIKLSGDLLSEDVPARPGAIPLRLRNPATSCEVRVDFRRPMDSTQQHQVDVPLILPRGVVIAGLSARVYCDRGWRAQVGPPWSGREPAPGPVVSSGERPVLDVRPLSLEQPPDRLTLQFQPTVMLATVVMPRVLVEESLTPDGGRWGHKRWLISKHRLRDVRIRFPAGSRQRQVFVDGQPVEAVAGDEGVWRVRLPAADAPCTLEVEYDFPPRTGVGVWQVRDFASPQIVEDGAVEEVRWIFHAGTDRLLMPLSSVIAVDEPWDWFGFSPSRAAEQLSSTRAWIEAADAGLSWSDQISSQSGGRPWQFHAFNADGPVQLISIRESFWVLICSGSCLILLLGIATLEPRTQVWLAVSFILVLVGLLAIVPEAVGWVWIGGRWGLLLGAIALAGHYLWRSRRPMPIGNRRWTPRTFGSSFLRELEPKTRVTGPLEGKR